MIYFIFKKKSDGIPGGWMQESPVHSSENFSHILQTTNAEHTSVSEALFFTPAETKRSILNESILIPSHPGSSETSCQF